MKPQILLAMLTIVLLWSQDAPRRKNTYHSSGGASTAQRLISPEVQADRRITFRLRAPGANSVSLAFSGTKPMTKGADGVWSVTLGPVEPEIYQYAFVVD